MSDEWDGRSLLDPISEAAPCGQALDGASLLAFDDFRVFAQTVALDAPVEAPDDGREVERRRPPRPFDSPEWLVIRERSCAALTASKDLRLLALLGAALLRTDGPYAFCQSVSIAASWLDQFWADVYPRAGEDTIERQSALSAFNDHFAVVEPLRRVLLVDSRQHGRFSLRDIEATPTSPAIAAAFDELSLDDLHRGWVCVDNALDALERMDARLRQADPDPLLSFDELSVQLKKLERALRVQLARRPESGVSVEEPGSAHEPGTAPLASGPIRTRQDAIRAIDAVTTFFKETEPSSPVPLLLDRAKRLVSKSFLEVLADIAPGALGEARVASGVRDQ
jgi:type VI secretion system protein ImpA